MKQKAPIVAEYTEDGWPIYLTDSEGWPIYNEVKVIKPRTPMPRQSTYSRDGDPSYARHRKSNWKDSDND